MKQKFKIGILFGGKSAEHEVSIQSAQNVFDAIDKNKYDAELIKINKSGVIENYLVEEIKTNFDVIFPVLHGPFGEDGTIQGLLKFFDIPFVGSSILGSAVGMDKDVMKRLLRDAGIKIGKFKTLNSGVRLRCGKPESNSGMDKVDFPVFIKPANLGSSVGISKVNNDAEYKDAIEAAFKFDNKIIIEENIEGREVECAVLGNDKPEASILGEIKVKSDFYSYDAKYNDEESSELIIPAEIDESIQDEAKNLAIKVFKVLCCDGMGRVDFFLKENGELIVNEINTIPGFTKNSMYPKLWEASGMGYSELIDRLIDLAIDRFEKEKKLSSGF